VLGLNYADHVKELSKELTVTTRDVPCRVALRLTDACTIRPRSDVMRSFRLATRAGSLLPALRASALLLGLPAAAVAQNSAQPAQAKKTTATPLEASIDKLATHPTVVAALGKIQSDNAWSSRCRCARSLRRRSRKLPARRPIGIA